MKASFVTALAAAAAISGAAAREIEASALLSEIYDSGQVHNELMSRKRASWDRQIASGEMNSTIYESRSAADGPVLCTNGVAAVVPGDRLNTFKCSNVSSSDRRINF